MYDREYYDYSSHSGIGENDPYADYGIGIAPIVGTALSLTHNIFAPNKDDGRLKTNQEAYTQAVAGNTGAFEGHASPLQFLLDMSGRGPSGGGWATSKAKDDAYAKYQAASAKLGPSGSAYQQPQTTAASLANVTANPWILYAGGAALALYMFSRKR